MGISLCKVGKIGTVKPSIFLLFQSMQNMVDEYPYWASKNPDYQGLTLMVVYGYFALLSM